MIKYSLTCKNCDLNFESWFASSKEYEKLKKKKLLNCHYCNSSDVEKSLMAPSLISKKFDVTKDKNIKKYNNIKKQLQNIKNLLKIILIMLEIILLMKQDLFITMKRKNKKEFMALHQKKKLKNLKKKGLVHR